jgi:ketosteroid isomerase-like protein
MTPRTWFAAVLLVGSLSLAAAPAPGRPSGPAADEAEVWKVIEGFNRAFAANDSATYFKFIDDRITVLTPSNPYRVEGIADDREEFEFGLRLGYGRIGYFQELQPRIDVHGEVAIATYFSRGSYGPPDKAETLYLKETDVLVKSEGSWKIVHIHVSNTAAR